MNYDKDVFGPLPKKKRAVFHHPMGFELYDALAMDLHAMTYAEQCVKAEREACAVICDELHNQWRRGADDPHSGPADCAAAIRARGES